MMLENVDRLQPSQLEQFATQYSSIAATAEKLGLEVDRSLVQVSTSV